MGASNIDVEQLVKIELDLCDELALNIETETDVMKIDRSALITWLKSAYLEIYYPLTVGPPSETISSIELKSYPKFRSFKTNEKQRHQFLSKAYSQLQISKTEQQSIEEHANWCLCKMQQKHKLVKFLISKLNREQLQKSSHQLLLKLCPDSPFTETEVDIIATPSGLYFCLPSLQEIKELESYKQRSESQQKELTTFIKRQKRFKFEQFEHFPMFSAFDARDTDESLIEESCRLLPELKQHEVILLLNTVVTFEETSQIEKYLIHDTWGHIWQHDLTDLNLYYDIMANMNRPLSPFDQVVDRDRIISLADIFVVNRHGEIKIDHTLKDRFIELCLEKHISALFAPVIAELTADIVEYFFYRDDPEHQKLLPSSSLFKHNPTKLDFAWMDMNYFCRKVKKIHMKLTQAEALKTGFCQLLLEALKLKFSRKFEQLESHDTFGEELEKQVEQFAKDYANAFDEALEHRDSSEQHFNAFDRLLSNLLRIQFTSNQIIEKFMYHKKDRLLKYRQIYILFICHYFCQNPQKHFWDLDEILARTTLPFLSYLNNLETQTR